MCPACAGNPVVALKPFLNSLLVQQMHWEHDALDGYRWNRRNVKRQISLSGDTASLGMIPAQNYPPNSLLRVVSGFKACSPTGSRAVLQNPGAQEGEHQEVTVRKEEDNEKNEGKQMLEVLGEEPARVFCCDLERMPCKLKAGEIHRAAGEALRLSCTQESLNIPSISHRARGSCTAQHSTHPAEARPQEWCFGTASSCVSGSI